MKLLRAGLCLAVVLSATPAVAGPIVVEFSGTVTASPFAGVPVGSTFTGRLHYDPSAALLDSFPHANIYDTPQPSSIWHFVDGSTITVGGPGSPFNSWLGVANDWQFFSNPAPTSDLLYWVGGAVVAGPLAAQATGTQVEIDLVGPNTLLGNNNLPNPFPSVQWDVARFMYFVPGSPVAELLMGDLNVTAIHAAPDPGSTLLLFGIGLVGLRGCRRRWQ